MSTQHTPGPWGLEIQEYGAVVTHNGGSIGAAYPEDMSGRSHNAVANGRLMAAAPELLAALWHFAYPGPYTGQPSLEDMREQARAAIAKATPPTPG